MTTLNFALIIQAPHACCFRLNGTHWQLEEIHGEPIFKFSGSHTLGELLGSLNEQINRSDQLAQVQLECIYAQAALPHLSQLPELLQQYACQQWQLVRLEPLITRTGKPYREDLLSDELFVTTQLLPLLQSMFAIETVDTSDAESSVSVDELQREIAQLRQELQLQQQSHEQTLLALQQRLGDITLPQPENVFSYLPIFYRQFWSHVSPQDLALMAGSNEIPQIGSSHTDPDIDTILVMKKRFTRLPSNEQQRIIVFCRGLTHKNLELRTEMREFFREEA